MKSAKTRIDNIKKQNFKWQNNNTDRLVYNLLFNANLGTYISAIMWCWVLLLEKIGIYWEQATDLFQVYNYMNLYHLIWRIPSPWKKTQLICCSLSCVGIKFTRLSISIIFMCLTSKWSRCKVSSFPWQQNKDPWTVAMLL